jgi:ribonucleoside-diphosphate reductase alpha chain
VPRSGLRRPRPVRRAENAALKKAVREARRTMLPEGAIQQGVLYARQGYRSLEVPTYSTDWDGEAYVTVAGQNSNNTVRVKDEFVRAVLDGRDWSLTRRVDGKVAKTVPARELWDQVAFAAWASADPASSTTPPSTSGTPARPRGASTPRTRAPSTCSWTTRPATWRPEPDDVPPRATGASRSTTSSTPAGCGRSCSRSPVLMAQFPSRRIAELSFRFRTLGLGYANLGGLLMASGLSYDSDAGRAYCAALTALMTGVAYKASAEMAAALGPFPGFAENRDATLRVLRNHRRAARGEPPATRASPPSPSRSTPGAARTRPWSRPLARRGTRRSRPPRPTACATPRSRWWRPRAPSAS